MKLHEYQSKFRFAEYGIPIPKGQTATTASQAFTIAEEIGGPVVVKAQVLAGGRGKAGGVKLAHTPEEAKKHARVILGMDIKGLIVKKILIDPAVEIEAEIYLGITIDRAARRSVMIASSAGGIAIEEVAAKTPEKIVRAHIDPCLGLPNYQARNIACEIGLSRTLWKQFIHITSALYRCYEESNASLTEINPLVVTNGNQLLALDGKMTLDDNALFRHPRLAEMRDTDEEAPAETLARQADLSYVKLDGEIGCMVNGAGLAMATMDMTKLFGGSPANFLDIGGGAKSDKVAAALRIILADPNVKAVLFNIFGGITRCDEVAHGILSALGEVPTDVPMVARLVGTNEEKGRAILAQSNMITAITLAEAAQKAVEAAHGVSVK
ncbi:MAG: ADP-forming succinate--CoA ligase subunit beta [Anaerolineae bacterium]|nr:ADP-forming succinate--CoA ligase subunit beta [Anaerolineae bacterium]